MYSLLTSGSLAAIQYSPNGCHQTIKFDRFGVELLAPRGNRLLALAGQRMGGQSDDGNVLGLRVAFQTPRGFPAVNNGHFEVVVIVFDVKHFDHDAASTPLLPAGLLGSYFREVSQEGCVSHFTLRER